jgi:outer membrane protein assembly factor BamB
MFFSFNSAGNPLWTYRVDGPIDKGSPAIALDIGAVVFASDPVSLYALDLKSGKLLWKYQAASVGSPLFITSPPSISLDGTAAYLIFKDGSTAPTIHAVSTRTGQFLWKYSISDLNGIFTSAVQDKEGNLYIGTFAKLISLTPSGDLRFSTAVYEPWSNGMYAYQVQPPILTTDGIAFFASGRSLYKIDLSDPIKLNYLLTFESSSVVYPAATESELLFVFGECLKKIS